MVFIRVLAIALSFLFVTHAAKAAGFGPPDYRGLDQGKAPEWQVSEWVKGPAMTLADQKGKVVLIDFFQLWCPGCNHFSIPLFSYWEQRFANEIQRGELVLVSIHTVFEGHHYQTPERLRQYIAEKGFGHPVANDRQQEGIRIPATMLAYGTRGTPEVVFVGKQGRIRFQHIGRFDVAKAEALIERLLAEN